MSTIKNASAVQLLSMLSKQEVSSREVTQHFIDRIETVNPSLNAVVIKLFDGALKRADEADTATKQGRRLGKLHGLPFTIKECLDLAGTPSTLGLLRRKNDIPSKNDAYVDAMLNEGGIILGKTNVPQTLMCYETTNPVYGTTNNPFSAAHAPGGSSGGEGAIIASGGSPVGVGTDIGGSVRIPAAFCGLCSIKPTMQRTVDLTRFVEKPLNISINSVTGILGNYAEDLALFLDIINSEAARLRKVEALGNYRDVDVSKLNIGYFLTDGVFESMPAVQRGVLETVERLKALGAKVTPFQPPRMSEVEELFLAILSANGGPLILDSLGGDKPINQIKGFVMLGKSFPFVKSILSVVMGLLGQQSVKRIIPYINGQGEAYTKQIEAKQQQYITDYLKAMDNSPIGKLDAIISPVCALPPVLHNTVDKVTTCGTYAVLNNVTGFPAGVATVSSVKKEEAAGRKAGADGAEKAAAKIEAASVGLPLAVQIAARPWNEHIVLALIEKLHKSHGIN